MDKKTPLIIISVLILAGLGFLVYQKKSITVTNTPPANNTANFDPLNATYNIDGQDFTFVNGTSVVNNAPGETGKTTSQIFGEPVMGELNDDGKSDAAVYIVQNSGGTGTFYYLAGAINTESGAKGTNAVFLGDRIAPQNIQIKDGAIIANYADRKPNDPMSAKPTVGVSKYAVLDNDKIIVLNVVGGGEHCGGNMANAPMCAEGFHCAPSPGSHLPFGDVGGICYPGNQ